MSADEDVDVEEMDMDEGRKSEPDIAYEGGES